jgi:hypothetical protein
VIRIDKVEEKNINNPPSLAEIEMAGYIIISHQNLGWTQVVLLGLH